MSKTQQHLVSLVLEIRKRLGPKGRIVIPKVFRDALKIGPGREVTLSIEDTKIVIRASLGDAVDVFERIARSGKPATRFQPHGAYEREVRRRRA